MNSQTRIAASEPQKPPVWQLSLAVVWVVAFASCFYRFDLPNSSPKVNRMQIWEQLPMLLVNAIDPPAPAVGDPETRQLWKQAGWRNLPQRFGLYGVSLWILACAWGWGHLLLRGLTLNKSLPVLESHFFAMGTGLSALSLLMLGCGLAGTMSRQLVGFLITSGVAIEVACRLAAATRSERSIFSKMRHSSEWKNLTRDYWPFVSLIPFLMCYAGGAFLPEIDFDVKEYHFGGPKEWYQASQITFLPHNVYTSFPFLTEMLTLLGMVLTEDWYWGAVAGKGVLMSFSLLTAMGLFAAGRRWFSPGVGIWAAIIHLSTPWIYRISIIAYAEGGLTFYLFASLFALLLFLDRLQEGGEQTTGNSRRGPFPSLASVPHLAMLAGVMAGSAMSCKYPGLLSVILPVGLVMVIATYRRFRTLYSVMITASGFGVGVILAVGPWLLKNLLETGNPVYPLMYRVFGGVDWTTELNVKWQHAHSPEHHLLSDLGIKLIDVTLKADWLSPLLFGLAPLAFLGLWNRRRTFWLWIYVAYLFVTWWALTHRIDRFWVPLIPVVSLLAAGGARWTNFWFWRYGIGFLMILALTFNFVFITSSLCGYNAYLLDLKVAADQTARITAPECVYLNTHLPAGAKVLCVGEAELFDARFPYLYNTVFDQSLFEQLCRAESNKHEIRLKPATELKKRFKEHGITHVLVNWQEILRYRTTYGYTNFVSPGRLRELTELGVLGLPWDTPGFQRIDQLDSAQQREAETWGPELAEFKGGDRLYRTFMVYPRQE